MKQVIFTESEIKSSEFNQPAKLYKYYAQIYVST